MEQIEPLDADLARLDAERSDLDGQAATLRAAIAEDEVLLDAELAKVQAERAALVGEVDAELLTEYDQLRHQAGGVAIARLVGGHLRRVQPTLCRRGGGPDQQLPPDEVVYCEECGRLLA